MLEAVYLCDGLQSSNEACEQQLAHSVDTRHTNKPATNQNDRQPERSMNDNYNVAYSNAKRGEHYIKSPHSLAC